ncbi:unnamed protein product, partial [Didymodactylos carnosus]
NIFNITTSALGQLSELLTETPNISSLTVQSSNCFISGVP